MSSDPRFSELMRELADDTPPPEGQAQARVRRARTVAHLRGLQARATVRREISTSWRKRWLVAAALLIPSAALGASLLPWSPFARAAHVEPTSAPASAAPAPARQSSKRLRLAPTSAVAEAATTAEQAPEASAIPETVTPPVAPAARLPQTEATSSSSPGRSTNVVRDPSTLADENRLMQAALAARRDGQNARCVQLLTELLTRHPGSPLAQNAEVERFRALLRSGDEQSAARQAQAYLSQYPNGMATGEAQQLAGKVPEPVNERSF